MNEFLVVWLVVSTLIVFFVCAFIRSGPARFILGLILWIPASIGVLFLADWSNRKDAETHMESERIEAENRRRRLDGDPAFSSNKLVPIPTLIVQPGDLVIIRGKVIGETHGFPLVNCRSQERNDGPLMMPDGDGFRKAEWSPSAREEKMVLIRGMRAPRESKVHFIAAPVGDGSYTTDFRLAPSTAASPTAVQPQPLAPKRDPAAENAEIARKYAPR